MTLTLRELWHGNLHPFSNSGKNNKELRDSFSLKKKNHERLEAVLNDNQKELLERYNESIDEELDLLIEQAFCDGYCLGTKITVEALTGADQVI